VASGISTHVVVWDDLGRVRWWYLTPGGVGLDIEALLTPQGTVVWGGGFTSEGRVREVDLWGDELYAFAPAGWQQTLFHHDAKQLVDGRLLTLEIRDNQRGNDTWEGFGIRAHDPATGLVSIDIDSQRYVDEGRLEVPPGWDDDPYHANWVDLSPDGSKVYVSLCFAQQILALDAVTGDLLWQAGPGLGWSTVDTAGAPVPEGALPQCQHGLEVLGDDHFLVYDNGQNRNESAASEWIFDAVSRTAELQWAWTEPGWSEPFLGDIDDLGNDRVLITQATFFGPSQVIEVDRASGQIASRLSFDNGGLTYRAERYDACELFSDATACGELGARHALFEATLTP